jgi:DNA-binding MarR family transcriptional regulator
MEVPKGNGHSGPDHPKEWQARARDGEAQTFAHDAQQNGAVLKPIEDEAWHGLLRAHSSIVKALDIKLDAAHGLPLSSYEVLLALQGQPDGKMRMAELAQLALLSRSGLTRLVDRLEGMGLIIRKSCEKDARGAYAEITERGSAVLTNARSTYIEGVRKHFLCHLGESELKFVVQLWEKLPANGDSAS